MEFTVPDYETLAATLPPPKGLDDKEENPNKASGMANSELASLRAKLQAAEGKVTKAHKEASDRAAEQDALQAKVVEQTKRVAKLATQTDLYWGSFVAKT